MNIKSIPKLLIIVCTSFLVVALHAQQKKKYEPSLGQMEKLSNYNEIERKQREYEEEEKKMQQYYKEMATFSRIEGYKDSITDDIFKYGLAFLTIISIPFCFQKNRSTNSPQPINKGLERIITPLILIGVYLAYCLIISKEGEFTDSIASTIKVALPAMVVMLLLNWLFVSINLRKDRLANAVSSFIITFSIILTGLCAYLLTSNIEDSSYSDKSSLLSNPWNWISFVILNGFLYYSLKIDKVMVSEE